MTPPPSAPPWWRPLLPHVVWEAVLLLGVLMVFAIGSAISGSLVGRGMLWWTIATTGMLATGLALSLRTSTPNLAVGALAGLCGVIFVRLATDGGLPSLLAAVLAIAVVTLAGAVLGLITGLTSAPAWAVSLGGLALASSVGLALTDRNFLAFPGGGATTGTGALLAGLVLVGSVAGGAACAVPAVHRWLVAGRSGADPRFRADRLVRALIGFTGSSLLAGVAGVATVYRYQAAAFNLDLVPLALALGAVLIGGVSVFGGRGGVAGTALGVVLVSLLLVWFGLAGAGSWLWVLLAGLMVIGGVAVSRLLEAVAPATMR